MKPMGKKKVAGSAPKPARRAGVAGDQAVNRNQPAFREAGARRRPAEEALRESEERYRRLFEDSMVAISQASPEGKLLRANLAYARLYGYASPAKMIAEVTDIGRLYADPGERQEVLRLLSEKGVMGSRRIAVVRRDGTRCYVEVQVQEVRDASGRLLCYQASHVDITERKRAEEAQRAQMWFFESLDRINRVMLGSNDLDQMMSDVLDVLLSIFDCDRASLVCPCDPEATSWSAPMERTRPEYPGALAVGLVEAPMDPDVARVFRTLLTSSGPVQFRPGSACPLPSEMSQRFGVKSQIAMALYPKVGKPWMFVQQQCSRPRVWTQDEERSFEEVGRRLTDSLTSLLAYRDLRASEERFHTVFERAALGIVVTDVQGRILQTNACFQRMLGRSSEDLIGRTFEAFTHPEEVEAERALFRKALQEGLAETQIQKRYVRNDGEIIWANLTASIHRDAVAQSQFVIGLVEDITERKHAAEALRRSETKFRTLYEATSDAVMLLDQNGFFDCNRATLTMLGCATREEFCSKHPADVSPPMQPCGTDSRTLSSRRIATAMEQGSLHFEWMHRRADTGEIFPADVLLTAMELDGTRVLQAVVRNITGRKRAEEALRESEENFRRSLDDSPLGVRIVSTEGETLYANQAILNIYGYDSLEQLRRTPLSERYTPESYAQWKIRKEQRGRGEPGPSEYEISIVRETGEVRHLRVFRKGIVWNGARQSQVIYQDITERKRAEEALRASEELYRELFDASPYGIVLIGSDGLIKSANREQSRMFRYDSPEEMVGLSPTLLVTPAMREFGRSIMLRRLSGEEIPSVGYRFIRKDGTEFWGETSARVLRDSGGSINGYIAIARDTTDRKQAEEKLRVSHERMRSLAARIEHVREEERTGLARELHDELGQGLTALQIDLAWLDGRLQTACAADLPGLRDKIAAMVPRAERLIETTQAISSSMRPGILDDLGLVAAIEWLAADFEKRTGLTCVATLPTTDITLDLALAVALFRIVQEALTNVVRHAKASRIDVRLRATGGELMLEIEDNGCGITPQQATGPRSLGLLSMRERAAAFGGTVDARSEAGGGTMVSVKVAVE